MPQLKTHPLAYLPKASFLTKNNVAMLKSSLKIMTLLLASLLSTDSMCSKEEDNPIPDSYASLLGKWNLVAYNIEKELTNGNTEYSNWKASEHPTIWIHWEFESNGAFTSSGDGGQGVFVEHGNWALEVKKGGNNTIEDGTLTLTGPAAKQAATLFSGGDEHAGKITAGTDNAGSYFFVTYEANVTTGYFPGAKKVFFIYEYRKL